MTETKPTPGQSGYMLTFYGQSLPKDKQDEARARTVNETKLKTSVKPTPGQTCSPHQWQFGHLLLYALLTSVKRRKLKWYGHVT